MSDDIERLASAVAQRFAASQKSARLMSAAGPKIASAVVASAANRAGPTLIARLASAVGQRLAQGSELRKLDPVASAVAKRLGASAGAAKLASAATRHYAMDDVNRVASAAILRLAPDASVMS